MNNKKPYKISIVEVYQRDVVIWADGQKDANARFQKLCDDGVIVISLDGRDYSGTDCTVPEEITSEEADNITYVFE